MTGPGGSRARGTRRRRGFGAATAIVIGSLAAGACGNDGATVLSAALDPTTTGASTSAPTPATARPVTTRAARTTTSARATTTAGVTAAPGAATTGPGTTGAARGTATTAAATPCRVPANRTSDPTIPGGLVASSATVGVRLSHPTDWPVTDVTVRAEQLLERRLVGDLGLSPTQAFKPLVVRHASQSPGLAVIKLPRPTVELLVTLGFMREFFWNRKFLVEEKTLTACLDGDLAVGMLSTNNNVLQITWFVYHGGSMYYLLCLADDDGNARSQANLVTQFNAILETVRWLD